MKNFLVFIAFVILASTSVHATIQNNFSNSFDALGNVQYKDKVWISVRNITGSSIERGMIVTYDTATYDDAITVSKVSNGYQPAACVTDEAIANGSMGKCLIYGYHDAIYFDAATASVAGEPIYSSSTTAGYSRAIAAGSVQAYNIKIGQFFDVASTSGTIEGFINVAK